MRARHVYATVGLLLALSSCGHTAPRVTKPPVTTLFAKDTNGAPAAWAVVEVRAPNTHAFVGLFHGGPDGIVALGIPEGVYDIQVTSPAGYAQMHDFLVHETRQV